MRLPHILEVVMCCMSLMEWVGGASAAVKLPAVIGDNMVLQRDAPVPIWGWADKGEEITVAIAGQRLTTKADQNGRWKVVLAKLEAGETLEMIVQGSSGSTITLKNILVGEVWVCSGQSNMAWGIGKFAETEGDIAAADYPQIRLLQVGQKKASEPAANMDAAWVPCTPESILAKGSYADRCGFSATAYYFGRQLQKSLNVPVGLIGASVGGTAAELWTSRKAMEADPALKPLINGESSRLYNGMIAPLIPYAMRGVIWYQGESNVPRAQQYGTLFPAMIADWRAHWGQGDFPFGFVQLAPFDYVKVNLAASPEDCAELREAQSMTLNSVPNTGMVVTMDITDPKDLHPNNKQEVGRRLALWALAKVYGHDIAYSGPIYKSMAVEGKTIRLQFDHIGGGLVASDGKPLTDFSIAGTDQSFIPATATIDSNSIVVTNDQVAQPVAVRFAWRDDATPNLANKEGLPASPFRTDTWKATP